MVSKRLNSLTTAFKILLLSIFLIKPYLAKATPVDNCPECNCVTTTVPVVTTTAPTIPTTTIPACPPGQHHVEGVNGSGCCAAGYDYAVNSQCSRCPEGQTYASGSCKQKCYNLEFIGYATNHDPHEEIKTDFSRSNSACGINLMEDVATAMLPPGRNTVDANGDIDTGGGGKPDGSHTRYEKVADMFTNTFWLRLVQNARGVCADKPFPTENIWTPDTTGGYYHLDVTKPNYLVFKDWFDCMHGYVTALDPATNTYKNYRDNINDYVSCYGSLGGRLSHSENTGFGGDGNRGSKRAVFDACQHGNVKLDSNCNLIKKADVNSKCGATERIDFSFESDTPISLVMDKDYDLNSNFSLVEFSLNQNSSNKFWVWKGSAKAPLLVYDPLHKGQINSAQQLFGSWTFGGKKLASIINAGSKPLPWSNGFEALSTLDADGDKKISGKELAPLGLWFDENQDAISQDGEVKLLSEVGIKELYFNPDREDKVNNTIEVDRGFVREVNGQTVSGKAVDWSAEGSSSQFSLYSKMILLNSAKNNKQTVSASPKVETEYSTKSKDDLSAVDGLWYWQLKANENSKGKPGFFILGKGIGNQVSGHTFAENTFGYDGHDKGEILSNLNFATLNGSIKLDSKGQLALSFSSEMNGGNVISSAVISADGKTMTGSSTAKYVVDGQEKTLKYSWTAKKKTEFTKK